MFMDGVSSYSQYCSVCRFGSGMGLSTSQCLLSEGVYCRCVGLLSLLMWSQAFVSYAAGVFAGPCTAYVDHTMAVVGYGTDASAGDYWILKNTWVCSAYDVVDARSSGCLLSACSSSSLCHVAVIVLYRLQLYPSTHLSCVCCVSPLLPERVRV